MEATQSKYQLVSCPFNPKHKVRTDRQAQHIIKCSAQHPCMKLQVCPYNALHRFPEKDRLAHVANCANRSMTDQRRVSRDPPRIEKVIEQIGELSLQHPLDRPQQLRRPKCAEPPAPLPFSATVSKEQYCEPASNDKSFKWPANVPRTVMCYPVDKQGLPLIPKRAPLRRPKLNE